MRCTVRRSPIPRPFLQKYLANASCMRRSRLCRRSHLFNATTILYDFRRNGPKALLEADWSKGRYLTPEEAAASTRLSRFLYYVRMIFVRPLNLLPIVALFAGPKTLPLTFEPLSTTLSIAASCLSVLVSTEVIRIRFPSSSPFYPLDVLSTRWVPPAVLRYGSPGFVIAMITEAIGFAYLSASVAALVMALVPVLLPSLGAVPIPILPSNVLNIVGVTFESLRAGAELAPVAKLGMTIQALVGTITLGAMRVLILPAGLPKIYIRVMVAHILATTVLTLYSGSLAPLVIGMASASIFETIYWRYISKERVIPTNARLPPPRADSSQAKQPTGR